MNIILIIVGAIIWRFGTSLFLEGKAHGGQGTSAGLVTLIIQLCGIGLVVWGTMRIFL